MKRILFVCLLLILAAGFGFAGGKSQDGTSAPAADSEKYTPELPDDIYDPKYKSPKFKDPVIINMGFRIDPSDQTLPPGDSVDDNQYTRALAKGWNIIVKSAWTAAMGEPFNQKMNLSIASNSLPDAVHIYSRTQLLQAASANLLYDLTDIWEANANDDYKFYAHSGNDVALESVRYKGRMMALPSNNVPTNNPNYLITRKDWLDKLGLPLPKTVEDIEKAAKAFIDAGLCKVGILGPGNGAVVPYKIGGGSYNFTPIFNAFDAYPGYWIRDDAGKVSYGSLSQNTKTALGVLADWYRKGLIDPEIGVRASPQEAAASGLTGIFFGQWWVVGFSLQASFNNDPNADWIYLPVYSGNGKWNAGWGQDFSSCLIVSKKASPDVAKAVVLSQNIGLTGIHGPMKPEVQMGWNPFHLPLNQADVCEWEYDAYWDVIEGRTTIDSYKTSTNPYAKNIMIPYYFPAFEEVFKNSSLQGLAKGSHIPRSLFDFSVTNSDRVWSVLNGDRIYAMQKPDKIVISATYDQTDGMKRIMPNLDTMEGEMMMKIITGREPLSSFDAFVTRWKAEGGDTITAEVQALPY